MLRFVPMRLPAWFRRHRPEPEHQIFFSYRRKDWDRAVLLVEALERAGIGVWVDKQKLDDFQPISDEIRKAIAASKSLLAFYSASYPDSPPCQMELIAAWLAAQAKVGEQPVDRVLVVNPEASLGHIPGALGRFELKQWPTDRQGFDALAKRICDHVGKLDGQLLGPDPHVPAFGITLHEPTNHFVGRNAELWQLYADLTADRHRILTGQTGSCVAQLVGLPGLGKSLLAQEFAIRFAPAFPGGIFWLRALDGSASRTTQINEFARQQCLPGIDTINADDVVHAFWRRLNVEPKPVLWIVDGLPAELSDAEFLAWLPRLKTASTLITTQTRQYENHGRILDLEVLTPEEAQKLLTRRMLLKDDAECDAAKSIARELGNLPLALEVAGSYIGVGTTTNPYRAFLTLLHNRDRDVLEAAAQLRYLLPVDHEPSIAATFLLALRSLLPREAAGSGALAADAMALDFLRLASVLAPAPIPLEFACELLTKSFADADGEMQFTLAIGRLDTMSLCQRSGNHTRKVHQLISRTLRQRLGQDEERTAEMRASAVDALGQKLSEGAQDNRKHAALADAIPHARHLLNLGLDGSGEPALALSLALYLFHRGLYREALSLESLVLEVSRRVLGEEHPDTLRAMNNLANSLSGMGELEPARRLQEQVLEVRRRVLGEEHPDTLTAMNNLASSLSGMGELEPARRLQEQVLEVSRRVLGEEHPDTLMAMSNLASSLSGMGELEPARRLQEQVLEVSRRVLGEEHPDTLTAMNNLASSMFAMGELEPARRLREQVLEVRRRVLGEEHPDTLAAMNNLAGSLSGMGELEPARRLEEQVLEVSRRVLGEEHPDTLSAMNNLASSLFATGELEPARKLFEWALPISRRVLGEAHPDTIRLMKNLAIVLRSMGDVSAAEELDAERQQATARRKARDEGTGDPNASSMVN